MNEDFFISKPIGTAASFTLTTRLGEMLRMAEERYGQRDCEFTLLGIEFWPGVPHLWFPGPSDCKHIAIRIGIDAIYDPIKAHFQLAHECIHLLSPVIGMASLLEEGLAVTFSLDYVQRIFGVNYLTGDSRYDKAKGLLDEALIVHPDLVARVRKAYQGRLSGITLQQLQNVAPNLSKNLSKALVRPLEEIG